MSTVKWLFGLCLAAVVLPGLYAEPRCLGNAAGLSLRLVQHSHIVVPDTINNTGPYGLPVDTGAQVTKADPALAAVRVSIVRIVR
jgi:hypothetical protein